MKTLDDIVDEYYNFIINYEEYINKNKYFDNELMDNKRKELLNFMEKIYTKEYLPWRKIEGNIKENLFNIFSSRNDEIISYLRVEDIVGDTLYDLGYMDLTKYYSNQGLDVKDDNVIDKIQQETSELIDKDVLDSEIFSDGTLKIHTLAREINNVCSDLWDIYKNLDESIEM